MSNEVQPSALGATLKACADVWASRCMDCELKPNTKGRATQLEAYLQGVLAALTASGLMTHAYAHQVAFMVSVGRGEELVLGWAKP